MVSYHVKSCGTKFQEVKWLQIFNNTLTARSDGAIVFSVYELVGIHLWI